MTRPLILVGVLLVLLILGRAGMPFEPTRVGSESETVDAAQASVTGDDLGRSFHMTGQPYASGPGSNSVYAASFVGFVDEKLVQVVEIVVASADEPVADETLTLLEHVADGDPGDAAVGSIGPLVGDSCTWWQLTRPQPGLELSEALTVVFRVGNHAAVLRVQGEEIDQEYVSQVAALVADRLSSL